MKRAGRVTSVSTKVTKIIMKASKDLSRVYQDEPTFSSRVNVLPQSWCQFVLSC